MCKRSSNKGTTWNTFSLVFTTNDLGGAPVTDGRLRFWLAPYDAAGDEYFIDAVSLTKTDTTCALTGDINCDNVVNILDYQILSTNFGLTNCGNVADIDGDCDVDIFDYNALVGNFGQG